MSTKPPYEPPHTNVQTFTSNDLENYDLWMERVWETLAEKGYLWLWAISDNMSSTLHLPAEFPDEELAAEPYDKTTEHVTCCSASKAADRWVYKPVDSYPVGFRDVCSYCMFEFVGWWARTHEPERLPVEGLR